MLAMLSPAQYPSRIAERYASRCRAARDRANCSNFARSSLDKISLDRRDFPARLERNKKAMRLYLSETIYS